MWRHLESLGMAMIRETANSLRSSVDTIQNSWTREGAQVQVYPVVCILYKLYKYF